MPTELVRLTKLTQRQRATINRLQDENARLRQESAEVLARIAALERPGLWARIRRRWFA